MQQKKDYQEEYPNDLMSFKELKLKHGFNYDYLYKRSIEDGLIRPYMRGVWKLSEREVLNFTQKVEDQKLSKVRANKGGN